jgi:16S rRNA processing protein RimM
MPLNEVRLAIGTIVGVHGTGGELKLRLATDDPEQLRRLKRIFVGEDASPRRLLGVRFHKGMALIRISGVSRPEEGESLRGQTVRISGGDARPLKAGEFYYYQVLGLTVVDEAGGDVGIVTDIIETGANIVFVVTPTDSGKEMLLPNIPGVVLDINPSERRMVVRPLIYRDAP